MRNRLFLSMSGRDYNSEQKKVDGGWAMMMSFMREGGGQSVQVCVVGSSEDRGASPDSQENRCDNMLCIIQKPEGGSVGPLRDRNLYLGWHGWTLRI